MTSLHANELPPPALQLHFTSTQAALPPYPSSPFSFPMILKRWILFVLLSFACGADDHYRILGVNRRAGAGEIKSAYRLLAKKNHPDKGGDKERFQKIQEAYNVLGDDNKRAEYDEGGGTAQRTRQGQYHPFQRRQRPQPQRFDCDATRLGSDSFFSFAQENDVFFVWVYNSYDPHTPQFAAMYDSAAQLFAGLAEPARLDVNHDYHFAARELGTVGPAFMLYVAGRPYYYKGDRDASLPQTPDDIARFFLDSFEYEIPDVTDSTITSFVNSYPHMNKILYVKGRDEGPGIPLEFLGLYKRHRHDHHFGITSVFQEEICREYGVPSYGKATLVVGNGGRVVVLRKGGLRPISALSAWVRGHQQAMVTKLTPGSAHLCTNVGTPPTLENAPTCALLFLPKAMPEEDQQTYIQAFESIDTKSTKLWLHSETQPHVLRALNMKAASTPQVLVFSTQHILKGEAIQFDLDKNVASAVEEQEAVVARQSGKRKVRGFRLDVLPGGERTPGDGWFGFKFRRLKKLFHEYSAKLPLEFVFAIVVIIFLWGKDEQGNRSGRSRPESTRQGHRSAASPYPGSSGNTSGQSHAYQGAYPQQPQPAQPRTRPVQPAHSVIVALTPEHLTIKRKFVVVFFVPNNLVLKYGFPPFFLF